MNENTPILTLLLSSPVMFGTVISALVEAIKRVFLGDWAKTDKGRVTTAALSALLALLGAVAFGALGLIPGVATRGDIANYGVTAALVAGGIYSYVKLLGLGNKDRHEPRPDPRPDPYTGIPRAPAPPTPSVTIPAPPSHTTRPTGHGLPRG